jgi:hypothetical protein
VNEPGDIANGRIGRVQQRVQGARLTYHGLAVDAPSRRPFLGANNSTGSERPHKQDGEREPPTQAEPAPRVEL